VGHARQYGPQVEGREQAYVPCAQSPERWMSVVVRTSAPRESIAGAVQGEVRAIDPALPLYGVRPMQELVSGSMADARFSMLLLAIFAAVAVGLAALGIYGVMACSMTQRRHEIGVRMALGAGALGVLGMLLRQGLARTGTGLALGVAAAAALNRLLQ